MKYPSIRIVFDRTKTATNEKAAPVYIEVVHNQKKRYVPTGVKVRSGEYDIKKNIVVKRNDCLMLNQSISTTKNRITRYILSLQEENTQFTFEAFDLFIKGSDNTGSFLSYMKDQIESRRDLEESTRNQHMVVWRKLEKYKKLNLFANITEDGIRAFDKWLHDVDMKGASQDSIFGVHKRIKPYVKEAKRARLIKENPYDFFTVERGKEKKLRYLLPEELEKIETVEIENESIEKVRDVFVFVCYTGLSYADIERFDPSLLQKVGDYTIYSDTRKKTTTNFVVVMLDQALAILNKYDYKLPVISNQKYNLYLKIVASLAGVKKDITSHMARHTFATTVALVNNMPLHIVQKVLGHAKISTTERYAKVINQAVIEEMGKLYEKLKEGK